MMNRNNRKNVSNESNNRVITLCGSTRYKLEFEMVAKKLCKLGWFVHSLEIYGHADNIELDSNYRKWLEDLHFWKIKRSNAVYIIDVDNYIGESTQKEIDFANRKSLKVYFYSKGDLM